MHTLPLKPGRACAVAAAGEYTVTPIGDQCGPSAASAGCALDAQLDASPVKYGSRAKPASGRNS